jgi:hypothetical protein
MLRILSVMFYMSLSRMLRILAVLFYMT